LGWTCSISGEKESGYEALVERPKEQSPLGLPGHGWKDDIEKKLKEYNVKLLNRVMLPRGENHWWDLFNAVMNLRVP
jgi:hypothetical protein